ncbi:tRNA (5-methylaminomethyl-2-thiouridine)(34)-methyltransferase MnmD [Porphyromonas catoniae]|uniref:tRNA (5-methylaminomethyl-2-thiouridine)(34)-methyltransferase MnmD n=1 Tax=Porphyromonas catoniae TaxID=41976 RepID=UPI0023F11AA3|nr:tRNA (5-methylaminomethyl-2-thiouridine)(34)-methyltransferase MnmD [Porphyromonas catoniae]
MMVQYPELQATEDGSLTLYTPRFGEHYHSTHGAVQESRHIYTGLALEGRLATWHQDKERPLRLFEVGLGTGLNALLTALIADKEQIPIHYTSIEKYPLAEEVFHHLSYEDIVGEGSDVLLCRLHESPWGEDVSITPFFTLHKVLGDLTDYTFPQALDVVYYDAFSPEAQPELWEERLFLSLYDAMNCQATLATYCAKGVVRRALQHAGFSVERLPGPPGKREVLRAMKVRE